MRVAAGLPSPLGASFDGRGTNFALFSADAESIELCLFDSTGREQARIALPEKTGDVWHGYCPGIAPGQHYGYRAHGPFDPQAGLRFNANKLLLDPYARAISGALVLNELHFAHRYGDPRGDLSFDTRDSAAVMVKGIVTAAGTTLPSTRPRIAWENTIIYEAHVKGMTELREDVPPEWRGRFRGLSAPGVVSHLKRLGVTAIELLPVQAFIDDWFVRERGLHNYWGYNTLGFFVAEARYGGGEALRETVARLHDAGIEVILDVVYNHSCEGDHLGPTLSFRGIDNRSYYRLQPGAPRYYENVTGTGNALDFGHPIVRQLALDSLSFFAESFDIDGFRFDLATTLGRGPDGFSVDAPLFAALRQDPLLSRLKLIAEPWDIGDGGYRVGGFPKPFSEWNDRFRRGMRRFWLGHGTRIGETAERLSGSSDIFRGSGRPATASINYIAAHDGFTLADVVSFERKHNEKNLEGNHDGEDSNDSTNCGVEGETTDPVIQSTRRRLRKALLASLLLARGVPMLLAGDEAANSQGGNNNAYCQDNETGWIDWRGLRRDFDDLTDWIGVLTALRRRFPQLRAQGWLNGRAEDGSHDVRWLTAESREMMAADWERPGARFLSYILSGVRPGDAALFIVLNVETHAVQVTLPSAPQNAVWLKCLDSSTDQQKDEMHQPGAMVMALPQSVQVFFARP